MSIDFQILTDIENSMIFVEGGTFIMGATDEQGDDCDRDERPAHQVTVSAFYIGKYPVTQAQWKAVMGNNPSQRQRGDNFPVENLSWNDTQAFIDKLNGLTGKNYRLPTEAEWEFAARGGVKSRSYRYSGSNDFNEVAWCEPYVGMSNIGTSPVGAKQPNELGIYDMSGNVHNWCSDWKDYYYSHDQIDPQGPQEPASDCDRVRALRGGSWLDIASFCRVACRNFSSPDSRSGNYGFRLVHV